MKFLPVIVLAISLGESFIPPTFKKCNRKSPNFRECLPNAVESAVRQLDKPVKELNIPSLEPLEIESLAVTGNSGVLAIEQKFKNCQLFGITQTKVEKFDLNFETKTLDAIIMIPKVVMNCDYEMDGKVLIMPIKGEGDSSITFRNFKTIYNGPFEEFQKHNKTYLRVLANKGDLDTFPESLQVHFTNLFNGNEELGEHINGVLNQNALLIYQDIKSAYNELIKNILTNFFNRSFRKITEEEAFD